MIIAGDDGDDVVARCYERLAAHAVNIARRAAYLG